jgi:SAM-dependent methyltransferase
VTELLPGDPARYCVISTGLDEISPALQHRYPEAERQLIDLYDRRWTDGGSIGRARASAPPDPEARPASPGRLPADSASFDAVFLVFAAHELRDPSLRTDLFREVARVLRPGGSLLLVEHCRDLANISMYGPGAWHFYPRREWLRLTREAGLRLATETSMTPLIRAWVFR